MAWRHTHDYHPVGIDQFDPKTHAGSRPIAPGSRVMKHPGQFGSGKYSFVHIEDEQGNHQQVFKRSVRSKNAMNPEDQMQWNPSAGEHEMSEWGNIFRDRRA